MARLTEEMVIARTRASNLSTIKKLNVWGVELQDVSLLRRLTNVEVLSMSVNNIATLADFQYCKKLQELFVRKNHIKNLNEILYLQDLPHLKTLWLGENPCADTDLYRLTVLKALPQLQKLDDVIVQPEEIQDALRKGRDLMHPEDDNSVPVTQPSPSVSPTRASRSPPSHRSSDRESSGSRKSSYSPDYEEQNYSQTNDKYVDRGYNQSIPERYVDNRNYQQYRKPSDVSHNYEPTPTNINNLQEPVLASTNSTNTCEKCHSPISPTGPHLVSSPLIESCDNSKRDFEQAVPNAKHLNDVCAYSKEDNGHDIEVKEPYERPYQNQMKREITFRGNSRRGSSSEGSGRISPHRNDDDVVQQQYEKTYRQSQAYIDSAHQRLEADKPTRPPLFPRRPVTRSSNLLSAVICLIRELDYPSLEVVEMAVRSRMDELED